MLASDDADLFARPADLKNGPVTIKMDSVPLPSLSSGAAPSGRSRRRLLFAWWPSERFLVALLLVLSIVGAEAASVPTRRTLPSNTNSPGLVVQQQQQQQQPPPQHQHRHHHHHPKPVKNPVDGQCAWIQWESDPSLTDVAGTRAYLAPVVFEGKARSRSDGPVYRVTFDVITVFKGDVSPGSQVRLEFAKPADSGSLRSLGGGSSRRQPAGTAVVAEPVKPSRTSGRSVSSARDSHSSSSSSSNPSGRAVQRRPQATASANQLSHHHHSSNSHHHRHHSHQNKCLVTAEIRTGRHYLVFANRWGPNNFTAFGSPIVPTKKSLKDVRSTLCPRCARTPAAFGLDESVTVKKSQRLILRCRTRGNPVPAVVWYKDGKPLPSAGSSKRVRIKTKRRRSTLRIRCVKEEDAGVYECRPNNVVGQGTAARTQVTVLKNHPAIAGLPPLPSKQTAVAARPANGSVPSGSGSSSLWPLIGLPCPIDSFCMNGGTCRYFEAVGELVCQCAEGYKGQRCENKDIYNLGKKCKGGRLVGNKCVPSYGPVGTTLGGTPIEIGGSQLGPTAAAGWAAVPGSPHVRWWHFIQNGQLNSVAVPDQPDDDQCPDDPDDD